MLWAVISRKWNTVIACDIYDRNSGDENAAHSNRQGVPLTPPARGNADVPRGAEEFLYVIFAKGRQIKSCCSTAQSTRSVPPPRILPPLDDPVPRWVDSSRLRYTRIPISKPFWDNQRGRCPTERSPLYFPLSNGAGKMGLPRARHGGIVRLSVSVH